LSATGEPDLGDLITHALDGDRRSLSRLISKVENDRNAAKKTIRVLYGQTGRATIVGVTGPPGSGKSTLIAAVAKKLSLARKKVAVVAIDPSSMFSGGALLGDRIRMKDLAEDTNVYIRSMATRGSSGGLSRATADVVRVLDAASWNYIMVETAGAGQTDLDIVGLAQTVVVVLSPGWGDEIQAFKAGLMEIGDIFVVNKSDLEGANRILVDVRSMLQTYGSEQKWQPKVIPTNSLKSTGISELLTAIMEHQRYVTKSGLVKGGLMNGESQLLAAIKHELEVELIPELRRTPAFADYASRITERQMDPYTAAASLISALKRK
jgi:LAO/AO transport system kinase